MPVFHGHAEDGGGGEAAQPDVAQEFPFRREFAFLLNEGDEIECVTKY